MNWIETQREKSFWMISSASCKKEVCVTARVCVCMCVFLSDILQSTVYLSYTHMGGVLFHFGDDCFVAAQPPCCIQANQEGRVVLLPGNGLVYLLLTHPAACQHTRTHTLRLPQL